MFACGGGVARSAMSLFALILTMVLTVAEGIFLYFSGIHGIRRSPSGPSTSEDGPPAEQRLVNTESPTVTETAPLLAMPAKQMVLVRCFAVSPANGCATPRGRTTTCRQRWHL